jgi:hypothetical protein
MTAKEIECYRSVISGADGLLEFGAGGSTLLACDVGISRIFSVESDAAWVQKVLTLPEIAALPPGRRPIFEIPRIGPMGKLGKPVSYNWILRWPDYHRSIWAKLDAGMIDCVLVDGRFRVACALQTILHTRPGTRIVIHDFWSRRRYHVLLRFLDVVLSVDNLMVGQRKPGVRNSEIKRVLFAHWFRRQ